MNEKNHLRLRRFSPLGLPAVALAALGPAALAQTPGEAANLEALKQQLAEQAQQLRDMRRALAQQEERLQGMRRALGLDQPGAAQGRAEPAPATVGQAPQADSRAPEVAPIFETPGVLTPKGNFVFEPALQYSYSSSNRIALVGYTIIPSILIGVVDVREVKRNTATGILTGRWGLTNRLELEGRLPYVYRSDTSIGREIGAGAASNTPFQASGRGVGDVEFSARYQINDGGIDKPYYVGGLRLKTRTGTDPFEVPTSATEAGLSDGVQTELPTGSGFYGLQPSLTMLYPSDPAVFFGSVSYLHNVKRKNVNRRTTTGEEPVGTVSPGGVWGFNFGMGLSLNERSSFSIGYDHSSVSRTKVNGEAAADSVRVQLGTLLLGYSHRLGDKRSLNVSLGAGLTRDTPDVTLTVRVPTSF